MPGEVTADALFVGLTRPPMLLGVSYTFVLLNGFISMITFILTSDFKYMFMMIPMHVFSYYICSKEPLFLELLKARAEKCSRSRNKFHHGCNSYDPY